MSRLHMLFYLNGPKEIEEDKLGAKSRHAAELWRLSENIMKLIIISAMLACHPAIVFANGSPEAEAFLKVPNAVWSSKNAKVLMRRDELPKEVLVILDRHYTVPPRPDEYRGYMVDLNADKVLEYIISMPGWGGTGGSYNVILHKQKKTWISIGSFRGGFYLLAGPDAWNFIVCISRGGSENYSKTRYVYEKGNYKPSIIHRFVDGRITRELIEQQNSSSK